MVVNKPFPREGNRDKRLTFAKLHKNWTEHPWQEVWWIQIWCFQLKSSSICMEQVRRELQPWVYRNLQNMVEAPSCFENAESCLSALFCSREVKKSCTLEDHFVSHSSWFSQQSVSILPRELHYLISRGRGSLTHLSAWWAKCQSPPKCWMECINKRL